MILVLDHLVALLRQHGADAINGREVILYNSLEVEDLVAEGMQITCK